MIFATLQFTGHDRGTLEVPLASGLSRPQPRVPATDFPVLYEQSRDLTKKGSISAYAGPRCWVNCQIWVCNTASSSTWPTPILPGKLWRGMGKPSNCHHCRDKAITHTIALCHPPMRAMSFHSWATVLSVFSYLGKKIASYTDTVGSIMLVSQENSQRWLTTVHVVLGAESISRHLYYTSI